MSNTPSFEKFLRYDEEKNPATLDGWVNELNEQLRAQIQHIVMENGNGNGHAKTQPYLYMAGRDAKGRPGARLTMRSTAKAAAPGYSESDLRWMEYRRQLDLSGGDFSRVEADKPDQDHLEPGDVANLVGKK